MIVPITWATLKTFVDANSIVIQWTAHDGVYFLTASNALLELTMVMDIVVPTPPGSDQQDFENNYKQAGNRSVSTSALQTTGNTSLGNIDTKTPSLGQAAMASSSPVVIASNQSAIPASQSGTWNINNISGSLSLPTGASTAAKQPALGTAGTPSSDVITVQGISSMTALKVDGSGVTQPISAASLPLPSGASTSALQTAGNSSLSSIDTKTPSLGQAVMASSTPVVLASNQSAIPASQSGTWTVQPGNTANTTAWKVDGSAVTQPVSGTITANAGSGTFAISAAALPLPSGAATVAKQPAIGTAGTASADVITVQGIASMTALKVDGSGVTQPISGTIAATQSGTWNVTNISGTVSLPTGASTETSLAKLTLAQASSTSGQTGPLMQGAVTTAAPTYTNAQTDPLSLTTAGSLRADLSSVAGTTTSTGNGTSGAGVQRVTIASDNTAFSVNATLQTGANTIGALTANQSVNLSQAAGNTLLTGNGVTGTGSPRVTIASDNSPIPVVVSSPTKTTYSAAVNNLTPPATPTDIVVITGSATKTVKVLRVELDATQAATGTNTFFLVKRSAANTGGTSANATLVPHDSNNAAATAVVKSYTANAAALGTAVGNVRATKVLTPLSTTATNNPLMVWDFDAGNTAQPIVLRGTAESLCLNFNGAALPSGLNITVDVVFTEE